MCSPDIWFMGGLHPNIPSTTEKKGMFTQNHNQFTLNFQVGFRIRINFEPLKIVGE
jgi:hypothetical protein